MVLNMAIYLDGNQIGLIGAELTAIGDSIAVIVAKKEICEEDPCEIAKLSVISDFLVLIGDTFILKSILQENQEDNEEQSCIEKESQRLGTTSAWLDVISDMISLQGSLLELQIANNKKDTSDTSANKKE